MMQVQLLNKIISHPKLLWEPKVIVENLIKHKYVVRSAPLPEDLSDDDETEEGTDVDDTSENESERSKVKKKFVKKLNRKVQGDLDIAREVMLPIFRYLLLTDLMNCMYVCRKWNGQWTLYFGNFLIQFVKNYLFALIGVVCCQPLNLNLSWTNISIQQLAWLMVRFPQLQTLNLTGSSAASISTLCSCNCPLLQKIDLSWVETLDDNLIKDLLSHSSESKPCSEIYDASLNALKRCTNFVHLYYRDCDQVSTIACQKFIATSGSKTRLIMKQTKLIVARNQRNPL